MFVVDKTAIPLTIHDGSSHVALWRKLHIYAFQYEAGNTVNPKPHVRLSRPRDFFFTEFMPEGVKANTAEGWKHEKEAWDKAELVTANAKIEWKAQNELNAAKATIQGLHRDAQMLQSRLPVIYAALRLNAPEMIAPVPASEMATVEIAASECNRFKLYCESLCQQLKAVAVANGEVPSEWPDYLTPPSRPIYTIQDLMEFLRAHIDYRESRCEIPDALRYLPEELQEQAIKIWDQQEYTREVESAVEDALESIAPIAEIIARQLGFKVEASTIGFCAIDDLLYDLTQELADFEITAYQTGSDAERAALMGTPIVEGARSNKKSIAEAKTDKAEAYIDANGPARGPVLAKLINVSEKAFYNDYSPRLRRRGIHNEDDKGGYHRPEK